MCWYLGAGSQEYRWDGEGPRGYASCLGAGSWVCTQDRGSGLPLQLQFSDVLTKWRRFFYQMAAEQGNTGLAAMDKKLKVAALQVGSPSLVLEAGGHCGAGKVPCLGGTGWMVSEVSFLNCSRACNPP